MADFQALWTAVQGFFTALGNGMTFMTAYWFVFIPMLLTVGRTIIKVCKSLLFYRSSRRRG